MLTTLDMLPTPPSPPKPILDIPDSTVLMDTRIDANGVKQNCSETAKLLKLHK